MQLKSILFSLFFIILFNLSAQQVAEVGIDRKEQNIENILGNTYKKTVFQGFWWDYRNDNFPAGWANYLTELAPRLKGMGVDAIWIPPTAKNEGGTNGVGYAPFDHYDLGDKYQKGTTTTRVGTKDDLLRMIAVLHANGIEVIQDIVPNHVIGAGSDIGGGGQDPAAPGTSCTDIWKNFRYVSYQTPASDQSATDYLARQGRFPKNHHNFHPNLDHSCSSGLCDPSADAWCWQGFGPDVCYSDGAMGLSSNATYNPNQTTYSPYGNGGTGTGNGYMRKHYREWLVWSKKQMGFDGVRIDAVKHFPEAASEDFLYNLQHTAGWANGGDDMFAVGEWVGSSSTLDAWTSAVNNRSGTFDFNLRAFDASGGLHGMIYGNGGFDMGSLPGAQQNIRYIDLNGDRIHRTVPFVNNHDTYRPQFDAMGSITGWNTGDELSPHVDIREPRLAASYAVAFAMDGNPQIFFEDLFNVANTGKRFSHFPNNTNDLPENSDLSNIILAHGALDFKGGDYTVPSNVASFYNTVTMSNNNDDILVIERSGKAIIMATDSWDVDQNAWIDTDFPVGTVLKDYSGGVMATTTVLGPDPNCSGACPNRVNVTCKAVGYPSFSYSATYADHGAQYHGYAIWAPDGQSLNNYSNSAIPTTQEWEMENDLGDSHCSSLGQGGRTPDNSPNARVVGKIFVENGKNVSYTVTLGSAGTGLTFECYDLLGNLLHAANGATNLTGSFSPTVTGWIVLKIRNTSATSLGQKCWIKATYEAPASIATSAYPSDNQVFIWTSNAGTNDWSDCGNWEEGKIPTCTGMVIVPHAVEMLPQIDPCFTGTFINRAALTLNAVLLLSGPYDAGTGLMTDNLRAANIIPTTEPYTALGFTQVNGGGETCDPSVFTVTGNDAIVDWIFLELRDKNDNTSILHTRSALLQRDGDVVDLDGISPVSFALAASDDYYVVLKHRNHLGVMAAGLVTLSEIVPLVDFRSVATYGTNAQKDLGSGVMGMYSGDVNHNGIISYNGASNDRVSILLQTGFVTPNNIVTSYSPNDVNMDGLVKYNGSGSDRVSILLNVGFLTPNNSISEQLP